MSKYRVVKVDREVFEAIRALQVGTRDTPGKALQRFLGLDKRGHQRLTDNIKCLKTMETQLRTQQRRAARKKHS